MPDPIKPEFTQFQELAQEVKDLGLNSPEYTVFVSAITAAEEKMAALAKTMKDKADIYLAKKAGSKYNSYTNARRQVEEAIEKVTDIRKQLALLCSV